MTNRSVFTFIMSLLYGIFLVRCLYHSTIIGVLLVLLCGYTIGLKIYFERKLENPVPLYNYPMITIVALLFSLVAWIYYHNIQPNTTIFFMFPPFIYLSIYLKMSKNWKQEEINSYREVVTGTIEKDDVGGMFNGMVKPPTYEKGEFYGSFVYNRQTYKFKIDVPLNTYLTAIIGDKVAIEISKRDPTIYRYHSMLNERTAIDAIKLEISRTDPD